MLRNYTFPGEALYIILKTIRFINTVTGCRICPHRVHGTYKPCGIVLSTRFTRTGLFVKTYYNCVRRTVYIMYNVFLFRKHSYRL